MQDTWSRFFTAERGLAVMRSWVVPRIRHQGDLVGPRSRIDTLCIYFYRTVMKHLGNLRFMP